MQSLAQITNPLVETKETDPFEFFSSFIAQLINIALVIAAIIFVFVIVVGGITWMSAGGDKQKVEAAQTHITNGLVGLLIVLALFALLALLETLFNIDILTLDIGKLIVK